MCLHFNCSKIIKDLPPTPSKFHYIFNLRDLSRIYHGMCLTTSDRFTKVEQFLRVWRNECLRVISDRLISDTDKNYLHVSNNTHSCSLLFHSCMELYARFVDHVRFEI